MSGFFHGYGMIIGWMVALGFLILLLYLTRNGNIEKTQDREKHRSAAQDILDRRYASGGISKEEYEEKSKDLQKHA